MSNAVTVGLIAAGSALLGVVASGAIQYVTTKAQLAADAKRLENDYRRKVYEDYLRLLFGIPRAIEDGIRALGEDQYQIVRGVNTAMNDVLARLALTAPAPVRELDQAVRSRYEVFIADADQKSKDNLALPRDDRKSVVDIYNRTFDAIMRPEIRRLAEAMQSSLR